MPGVPDRPLEAGDDAVGEANALPPLSARHCPTPEPGLEIGGVIHPWKAMARALVIFGLVLVALGLLWPLFGRLGLGLGRLPATS